MPPPLMLACWGGGGGGGGGLGRKETEEQSCTKFQYSPYCTSFLGSILKICPVLQKEKPFSPSIVQQNI